jgi:hypothetical protein
MFIRFVFRIAYPYRPNQYESRNITNLEGTTLQVLLLLDQVKLHSLVTAHGSQWLSLIQLV